MAYIGINSMRSFFLALGILLSFSCQMVRHETHIIVGGGHIGIVKALRAQERAEQLGQKITIRLYTKNNSVEESTAANIWNSHTDNEILAVVPPGKEMRAALQKPFYEPGGIRVERQGVNDSKSALRFIDAVEKHGGKSALQEEIEDTLLRIGRGGMSLWKNLPKGLIKEILG